MTDIKQLTPQGIPSTSFADKAEELEKFLGEKTTVETKLAEKEAAIRDLFYDYNLPKEIRDTEKVVGLEDKLTIYLPEEPEVVMGLVYTAAKLEGRAFAELAANPSLLKRMEKKFGAKITEFIRQVDDVFHYKEITKERKIDTKQTTDIKSKYIKLIREYQKLQIELRGVTKKIENVDAYIAFCKSIVALAPAQSKGGDKQQQQKGGQVNG
jgi:hypothetical protein